MAKSSFDMVVDSLVAIVKANGGDMEVSIGWMNESNNECGSVKRAFIDEYDNLRFEGKMHHTRWISSGSGYGRCKVSCGDEIYLDFSPYKIPYDQFQNFPSYFNESIERKQRAEEERKAKEEKKKAAEERRRKRLLSNKVEDKYVYVISVKTRYRFFNGRRGNQTEYVNNSKSRFEAPTSENLSDARVFKTALAASKVAYDFNHSRYLDNFYTEFKVVRKARNLFE